MPKRGSSDHAEPVRRSVRAKSVPTRFNPSGNADIPDAFESMVESISAEACKASPMPLSDDAASELRGVVATAAMVFIEAAQANAAKRGADDVADQDFDAVLQAYKAQKTSGNKSRSASTTTKKKTKKAKK